MPRIHISEATEEQLRFFAETVLGLDLIDAPQVGHVIGQIRQHHESDFLDLPEQSALQSGAVKPLAQVLRVRGGRDFGPPVTLTLLETDQPGGKHPASPSVNGVMLVVQRNVRVIIPYAFYLCLRNARQTLILPNPKAEKSEDEPMTIKVTVTNFPMEDVEKPSLEEIRAWHAKEGHKELAHTQVSEATETEREAA